MTREEILQLLNEGTEGLVGKGIHAVGSYYKGDKEIFNIEYAQVDLNKILATTRDYRFLWHEYYGLTFYGEMLLKGAQNATSQSTKA